MVAKLDQRRLNNKIKPSIKIGKEQTSSSKEELQSRLATLRSSIMDLQYIEDSLSEEYNKLCFLVREYNKLEKELYHLIK